MTQQASETGQELAIIKNDAGITDLTIIIGKKDNNLRYNIM
jgi:hypothetical protein